MDPPLEADLVIALSQPAVFYPSPRGCSGLVFQGGVYMREQLEDGRSHWFGRENNPDGKAEVAKEVAGAQLVNMAEEDVKG
jgi:hypothetical protein